MPDDLPAVYDTRSLKGSVLLGRRLRGSAQYILPVAGQPILYSYIRKNGCSAFKRLARGACFTPAQIAEQEAAGLSDLQVMDRHYRARGRRDLQGVAHRVFVHRPPRERIVSVYCNKFIQQAGAAHLLADYARVTGRPAQQASFADFVCRYLGAGSGLTRLDQHVWPQKVHLLPIRYTAAIPLAQLHAGMRGVIGAELADRYFARPVNATGSAGMAPEEAPDKTPSDTPDSAQVPAGEWHALWQQSGHMPGAAQLVTADLGARIDALYHMDADFA